MAGETWLAGLAGVGAAAWAARWGGRRLRLSRAKAKGPAGHVRMAKRMAGFIPFYEFTGDAFFAADGAPAEIAAARKAGFERLSALYKERYPKTAALTAEMRDSVPDIAFTGRYRVPFQFSRMVREGLPSGSFYQASDGVMLTDLDGNRFYDLTGSYGVNLLGTDAYKALIAEGAAT